MAKETSKALFTVDFNEEVVKSLGLQPMQEYDYLCRVKLVKLAVEELEIPTTAKDGSASESELAGKVKPSLVFYYENITDPVVDPHNRSLTVKESLIVLNTKDGSPIEHDKIVGLYKSQMQRIVHVCETFLGNKKLRENAAFQKAINEWLAAPLTNDIDKVIVATKNLYTVVATIMDNDGAPVYKGKSAHLKILAEYNEGKYFTIPNFVEDGFIELIRYMPDKKTIIKPGIKVKEKEMSRIKLRAGRTGRSAGGSDAAPAANEDLAAQLAQMGM